MKNDDDGLLLVCGDTAFLGLALELAMTRVFEEAGRHPSLISLKQLDLGRPAVAGEVEHLATCRPCAARQVELHKALHPRSPAVVLRHVGLGRAGESG